MNINIHDIPNTALDLVSLIKAIREKGEDITIF